MQRPVNSVPSRREVNSLFAYKVNFASQCLLLLLLFLSLSRESIRKGSRLVETGSRGVRLAMREGAKGSQVRSSWLSRIKLRISETGEIRFDARKQKEPRKKGSHRFSRERYR